MDKILINELPKDALFSSALELNLSQFTRIILI